MLLGSQKSTQGKKVVNSESTIVALIKAGWYAQAYQLISSDNIEKNIAMFFNLALCYYYGKNYEECVSTLNSITFSEKLKIESPPVDKIYKELLSEQQKQTSFLHPLTIDVCLQDLVYFRELCLRLQLDCFLHLEMWTQILTIAPSLVQKGYTDVEVTLMLARKKSQNNSL